MSRVMIPNSTQIPDVILDYWMGHLSGAEFKVVMYVARRTYGFGKDSDTISLNQLANGIRKRDGGQLDYGTGLSRSSVKSACGSLVAKKILIKTQATVAGSDEPDENTYRLNLYPPSLVEGDGGGRQQESTSEDAEVGQKITYVGQKITHPVNANKVGQKITHVGQKLAHGRPKITHEVGQKLAPQETEQETDLQETAAERAGTSSGNHDGTIFAAAVSLDKKTEMKSETASLVERLVAASLNRADAERFANTCADEARRQLEFSPFKKDLDNPGGYLRRAIEGKFPPPKEFQAAKAKTDSERKKQEEVERRKAQEAAKRAADEAEAAQVDDSMARLELSDSEAFLGFMFYLEAERRKAETRYAGMSVSIRTRMMQNFDTRETRRKFFTTWLNLPDSEKFPQKSEEHIRKSTEEESAADVAALVRASLDSGAMGLVKTANQPWLASKGEK